MPSDGAAVALRTGREPDASAAWNIVTSIVLDGITSTHTRRAYEQAIEEFLIWFKEQPEKKFNKAAVQAYRAELEKGALAASTVNVHLSAIRRLALEAADNGLMPPELAAGIARAKGAKRNGVRLGQWLTAEQADVLLRSPDNSTLKGMRGIALLSMLLGCGLRRTELTGLDCEHIQQRDGRWLIVDLFGKHGRVRTVPIPSWGHAALTKWQAAANIHEGPVFRSRNRHGRISLRSLSPQAVYNIVTAYARKLGMKFTPHDLRRTFARLAHNGRSPIEQIQLSLGHSSVVTTERYLGVRQDLRDAPCDRLGLGGADPA